MKKIAVSLNVYVTLSLTDDENTQTVVEDLESYIEAQIGLDFFPDDIETEIIDVEELDA